MKNIVFYLVLFSFPFFTLNTVAQSGSQKYQEVKALRMSKGTTAQWTNLRADIFDFSNGILRPAGNYKLLLLAEGKFVLTKGIEKEPLHGKGTVNFPGGARFSCNGCGSCSIKKVENGGVTHYICEDNCGGDCAATLSIPDDSAIQMQTSSGDWRDVPGARR